MENENGSAAKKRKLSTPGNSSLPGIQLDVLQYENKKLKEQIQKLEAENQHYIEEDDKQKEQIAALNETITVLQVKNEENEARGQIDSLNTTIETYSAKMKSLEEETLKDKEKIKKLEEEISLMKTIKSEIKDTVENDRETAQATIDQLKAEIMELKNKNNDFEINLSNSITKNETLEKSYISLNMEHQELHQKYEQLETIRKEEENEHQNTITSMLAANDNLIEKLKLQNSTRKRRN